MRNLRINIDITYEDDKGNIHSRSERYSKPSEAMHNWIDDCVADIENEQTTERRIEERGNDIMFTDPEAEQRFAIKHA